MLTYTHEQKLTLSILAAVEIAGCEPTEKVLTGKHVGIFNCALFCLLNYHV